MADVSRARPDVIPQCGLQPNTYTHHFPHVADYNIRRRSISSLKMPPRFNLTLNASATLRAAGRLAPRYARYSTEANTGPLLRVTNLPAPNSGHIRILELNRPAARNAISRGLLSSLREEIDAVHEQYDAATGEEIPPASWNKRFGGIAGEDQKGPTRALILASAVDTSFCAGADLKERKTFTQEE